MNLAIIGCGIKAQQYLNVWIKRNDINIIAAADVSTAALEQVQQCATEHNSKIQCFSEWQQLLADKAAELDAVYICSPHAFHADQAISALNAGLDVLLEKPMVMTVTEAEALQAAQATAKKALVVAYQGGLSPLVHQLAADVEQGSYGTLTSINACIWEGWAHKYKNHWKQNAKISGGGFMFDTGAHMMNTVSMICGSDFDTICAFMDNHGYPVDAVTAAIGRLQSGVLFNLHASGETIDVCQSRIELFFTEAIVRVCAWGRWIEIEKPGQAPVRQEQEAANNLMNIFNQVKAGEIENPSPVSQGLKMAKLWDAVKDSAAQGGMPVQCH